MYVYASGNYLLGLFVLQLQRLVTICYQIIKKLGEGIGAGTVQVVFVMACVICTVRSR